MARAKQRTSQVEELRPYVEGVAKNLVDKLYGPKGPAWGTRLTEIEDVFLEIRAMLTAKMLDLTLGQQADALDERPAAYRQCPCCQQPLAVDDTNPRSVQTRAGPVEWSEPESYCDRCRRAFFPSVQEPGD